MTLRFEGKKEFHQKVSGSDDLKIGNNLALNVSEIDQIKEIPT